MNDIQSNLKIDDTNCNVINTNNETTCNSEECSYTENQKNCESSNCEINTYAKEECNTTCEATSTETEKTYNTAKTASYATTTKTEKSSVTDLQKIVQKMEKLEKMINPNSKKSLILWEEDNSFKNLISSIVSYATTCDTTEFPIELLDKLKALATDVDNQIAEGATKVKELTEQAKINTDLSQLLAEAHISATAGNPIEDYEAKIQHPELAAYREHLIVLSTAIAESEEYIKAEKAIKSKVSNLENSVHITIDLERTTSKGGALQYIKTEIAPAVERLQAAYDEQHKVNEVTQIDGEEAIMALAVRKTFSEKVYDTFVRPFTNLFKRKSKAK